MLKDFKNKYKDDTCIVIGNGPSLRDVIDNHADWLIAKYTTFGSNRIFLEFIPSFYVVCNKLVIEQNRKAIDLLDCHKFIPQGYGLEGHEFPVTRAKIFAVEPYQQGIYEGYTVTYVSLQLAYYMGFTTVLLVGVDHRYQYDGKPNEAHVMQHDDPNHFNPEYFKGQLWNNPDLKKSEESYQMADDIYKLSGRRIINLTPNSDLNIFEKDKLENWL